MNKLKSIKVNEHLAQRANLEEAFIGPIRNRYLLFISMMLVHLHYDLRLEDEGVLKSWAIPKGPSTDPDDKRLAIETEDHPLEYAHFEGVIAEGNYGAGGVIIWDTGTFKNLKEEPLSHCLQKGKVEVWLNGEKLTGCLCPHSNPSYSQLMALF